MQQVGSLAISTAAARYRYMWCCRERNSFIVNINLEVSMAWLSRDPDDRRTDTLEVVVPIVYRCWWCRLECFWHILFSQLPAS